MIRNFAATFVAFYLGCALSFLLQQQLGLSSLFASAFLGFLVTFFPSPKLGQKLDAKELQFIFYTGTFAAMSSSQILAG